jgi:flagellar protein FliS
MSMQSAFVQHYRRVNTYGGVEAREPHTLVEMLYGGLAEAISNARGALGRGDMAGKGHAVVRAIDILESLRTSLDLERGGELAGNLNRLYAYMEERLTEANLRNEPAVLDELSALNETLRDAWASIPAQARQRAS